MNIYGRIVVLRALELEDMEELRSYHNDPDVANCIFGWSYPLSAFEQKQWYERSVGDPTNKRFAIVAPPNGFIGVSTLTRIDLKYRSAYHGVMIGKKDLYGRGYGTDTVMATMRYAFEELGLERLDTDIIEPNEASLHLYVQRCGWTVEGKRRRTVFRNNQWCDSYVLGILRDDYLRLIEKTHYW